MAFYADEEEVWKCPKHPSKCRRCGICPVCLRDRLSALCPDCGTVRPCSCCTTTTSSSSSSSSSFSRFSSSNTGGDACVGSVGRVSNLIDSEPAFRRSRSVAIPFIRSRLSGDRDSGFGKPPPPENRSKSLFWSVFKKQKSKKGEESDRNEGEAKDTYVRQQMMMRSRSVCVPAASDSVRSSPSKSRGWYFPSPMKAFRHSKSSKVVQERSPLYRG